MKKMDDCCKLVDDAAPMMGSTRVPSAMVPKKKQKFSNYAKKS